MTTAARAGATPDVDRIALAAYVLGLGDDALILASQAVAVWVTQGLAATMNRFNGPSSVTGGSSSPGA